MHRRDFLRTGIAGLTFAGLAQQVAGNYSTPAKRVGLIGSGWYGKCDLLRLIQVEPVDVVSLSDPDSKMVADAADLVATRQKSSKKPRTYGDYREQLKEKDLDIVLVGTPDHWHALTMIAAVEAGADVYCQKPTSVDVAESYAMLDAARKHKAVVQIGTQRRSTPHLVEAKNDIIESGKLGNIAHVELCCYYHMRARGVHPSIPVPDHLDYEMWTGPAPMLPYTDITHPRRWRAFMEYGNGIVGDMCVHMLDTARWMLGLGWPTRISSTGGIYIDKGSTATISDTQTATFDFGDLSMVWNHRAWGNAVDSEYPWAAIFYGDRGTLKVSVKSYDFIPRGGGEPIHRDVTYELEQYPEDQTEKDLEKHVAPACRYHQLDFLKAIANRSKPVADIEEGLISSVSCILANNSMELGRSIQWDPENRCCIGDDEANAMMKREYRGPWVHPAG